MSAVERRQKEKSSILCMRHINESNNVIFKWDKEKMRYEDIYESSRQ